MNLIDNYIEQQDEAIRDKLILVRKTIKEAIPDAEERISYGMPTFWKGRNVIHFAAAKKHIGIYPGGEATTVFADKLTGYKTSKGAIQLPLDKELPLGLIAEIAKWSYRRNARILTNNMNIVELLKDKSIKGTERRQAVVNMIVAGELTMNEVAAISAIIGEKQVATVLEAVEEVSNKRLCPLEAEWLQWSEPYISSENNSCRREASRIVGNMAAQYPDLLDDVIDRLMKNTSDEGTVIRWAAAYALVRIVVLDRYAKSDLYDRLAAVCDREEDNGVKNQYLKALKKAAKIRK